jgi:ribosomal protein S18 acetylase RimI-like enzyme
MSLPLTSSRAGRTVLAQAIESDCSYFEMGARVDQLDGATLAWMPGLTASPGAAVIHRVDPHVMAEGGVRWFARAEAAMTDVGAALSRIYLDDRYEPTDSLLRGAGYVARDELIFIDALPEPSIGLTLGRVSSEADWARKLDFHLAAGETPDGHGNHILDWVELERRKCGAGMESFLAELDGAIVGAVGAIWCDRFVRTKNLIVAPQCRRQGIARAMLGKIAELGRRRGLHEQCVLAVRGEQGELLYRALGMAMIGMQVEWSKPIPGAAQ